MVGCMGQHDTGLGCDEASRLSYSLDELFLAFPLICCMALDKSLNPLFESDAMIKVALPGPA